MFSMLSLFASMLLSIVQYGEERSLQALVVTSALKILDCPWRKQYSAAVELQRMIRRHNDKIIAEEFSWMYRLQDRQIC